MNRKLFSKLNARRAAAAVSTAMMLAALGLAGCGSSAGAAGATLSEPLDAQTVSAVVESVEGDTLTVLLVDEDELPALQEQMQEFSYMPDGSLGDPATMTDSSQGQTVDGETAEPSAESDSESTNGDQTSEKPDGEEPSGIVEATITVADENVIVASEDGGDVAGGLDAIEMGSVLMLTVEDDGTSVSKIEVVPIAEAAASGQGASADDATNGNMNE